MPLVKEHMASCLHTLLYSHMAFVLIFFFPFPLPKVERGLQGFGSLCVCGRRRARDLIVVHALGGKGRRRHRDVESWMRFGNRVAEDASGRGSWSGCRCLSGGQFLEKYYRIVDRRRGGGISLYLNFAEEGPCVHNHGVPGREF